LKMFEEVNTTNQLVIKGFILYKGVVFSRENLFCFREVFKIINYTHSSYVQLQLLEFLIHYF